MWGVFVKVLTALATVLPAILDWWTKRRAAQGQTEIEARKADDAADIRADNKSAWLCDFGPPDQRTDKPEDSDNQTGST